MNAQITATLIVITAVFTLMVYVTMVAGEHFRPEVYGEVFDECRRETATGR